jgi:CBS domain-containing protein
MEPMTCAREIMTPDAQYLDGRTTVEEAARHLATRGLGFLPICDPDGHLVSTVTDRDVVLTVVAKGRDPSSTRLIDLERPHPVVTVGADDPVEDVVDTMKHHQIRRVPVVDGTTVVGVLSQADIAQALSHEQAGDLLAAINL